MIFEKLKDIIAEQLSVEADEVSLDSNIQDDLGADSLDVVDLITTIDGTNILNGHAIEKAKLKILDGERVTLAYVRSNKQYETTLALDMDALLEEQNAEKADNSEQAAFMDELLQLADLYKTGLLTDEEFAAAKQKLLGN